jgi:uncharacterized coiled-coil protein SlyX
LAIRPAVARGSRHDPGATALESVAAEFALLAQRRARAARQLDLLGRQVAAAQATLDSVQGRMTLLAHRMNGIDPSLRTVAVLPPQAYAPPHIAYPAVPAYVPPRPEPPHAPSHILHVPRMKRQLARRRPLSPE